MNVAHSSSSCSVGCSPSSSLSIPNGDPMMSAWNTLSLSLMYLFIISSFWSAFFPAMNKWLLLVVKCLNFSYHSFCCVVLVIGLSCGSVSWIGVFIVCSICFFVSS